MNAQDHLNQLQVSAHQHDLRHSAAGVRRLRQVAFGTGRRDDADRRRRRLAPVTASDEPTVRSTGVMPNSCPVAC